jgi:teichuronic acid biosynthesis glycosyltransferase TuaG
MQHTKNVTNMNMTLIITCYNSSNYIRRTISNIASYCMDVDEIIFVDDCSSDDTIKIIYDSIQIIPQLKILKTSSNTGGPATPRNIGLLHASNEYVMFLDADDQLLVKSNELFSLIIDNDLDAISFSYSQTKQCLEAKNLNYAITVYTEYQQIAKNRFKLSGSIYKKESILSVGYFNEDKDFVAVEDYIMWSLLIINKFKVGLCSMQAVNYLPTNQSISRSKYLMLIKNWKAQKYLLQQINRSNILMRLYCIIFYIISSCISYIIFNFKRF